MFPTSTLPCVTLFIVVLLAVLNVIICQEISDLEGTGLFRIDGKVDLVSHRDKEWLTSTRVLVDGGEFVGYLRYV